jgi:hypothetical protein
MAVLELPGSTGPSTNPQSGSSGLFLRSSDNRWCVRMPDGTEVVLQPYEGFENAIINGGFSFAQRQAPGTLTTYSNTSGRSYGADRWGMTNENASMQYQRIDTAAAPETGLTARYYGKFKKTTSTGKMVMSQVVEGQNVMSLRGRQVRLQAKMKYSVAGAMTVRLGLLQLTAAGTIDTIPATFVSAFGAAGTDPTWGTNLTALTPSSPDGGTISGLGLTCVLSAAWVRYSAVFTVPSDCKNLIPVIYTNGQPAALDELNISEVQLNDGAEIMDWSRDTYAGSLQACQRYYSKSFNADTLPAQSVAVGALRGYVSVAGATAGQPLGIRFPQPMRAAPTLTFYNPAAANAFVRNTTAGTDATATASANMGEEGGDITFTGIAAWTVAQAVQVQYSADAEL